MSFISERVEVPGNFNDQEVWQQLRLGDRRALECLYRRYGKDLYNFGMKLYGKQEWVQDILQELFIDLWNQRQKLSAVTSVKSYLFKSLRYKLNRQYGKEKRWVCYLDYENLPVEVELPVESTIIADQVSKEQRLKLAKSLEKLPARQREVLHLLFHERLTYEEAAGIMQINVRSAYTLAWKGISSLKRIILVTSFFLFCNYLI